MAVQYPSWGLRRESGEFVENSRGWPITFYDAAAAAVAIRELALVNVAIMAHACAICGERFTGSASDEMVEAVYRCGKSFAAHYSCTIETDYELA